MKVLSFAGSSLTRRMLLILISTLSAVAMALGAGGSFLIHRVVERSFDKLLGASASAIADTLAAEKGEVTLDVPPAALDMLENAQRDNVYYSVHQGPRLLTGYPDLPAMKTTLNSADAQFRYSSIRLQTVRIAAETRWVPQVSEPIVVEVAQTLGERRALERVMLAALFLLEATFILLTSVLVWPAVKWGLRPVNRLRAEIDAHSAEDMNFAPLDIRNAPTELRSLLTGFNDLLRRLEGSVAGVRRFTADASHQMRTPVAVLKTHLAVLSAEVSHTSVESASLADVQEAVIRLEALLTRLISLAHADDAVQSGIVPSRIDLREVIAQVVGNLVPLAAQRDIALHVDMGTNPVWVFAEEVIAAEILTNLLDNAIRYNRPQGEVFIKVEELERFVTMHVEDNGPGVPEPDRRHILDRFYRLPRDQAQPGTGLGLSIVKTLSEALHATLEIGTASSGQGLRVSVQFETASLLT